jgi:hypothetical protein
MCVDAEMQAACIVCNIASNHHEAVDVQNSVVAISEHFSPA